MLPDEYLLDTKAATKSLQQLADSDPETKIALTIARITEDGGIEQETEIVLPVTAAAALLTTVGKDQRLLSYGDDLYLLRVTRLADE